ncbi:MAG: O-antigen polymerase [Marinobacter sp. T13-3]|nr:MAG: O-antigen polymerase [Marinobacter sp. T13-3]
MIVSQRFIKYLLPFLLLSAWIFGYFGYLGWKPGFAYNAHRYFEIFLLGIVLSVGIALPVRFRLGLLWSVLCIVLLSLMLVVVCYAGSHWLAVRELLQYLTLFAAILVVAKSRHGMGSGSFDRAAIIGLVLFCFGCALMVLEGLLLSLSIQQVDHRLIFGAFVNVRIFSELQALTLLLMPAAWLIMDSDGWRRFISLTAMLWWGLLLLTGTRSALVALPFALLVLGLVGGSQTINWFKLLLVQFIGGVVAFLFLKTGISWYLGLSFWGGEGAMSFARATSSGRFRLWEESWGQFLEHPWLGNGPGSFACFTENLEATPHNLFFQLLSEWGIFMTLLCFALALLMFFTLVRNLRNEQVASPLKFSLFVTLVAVVATSMMQGMIIAPLQQMLIVLLFGWALHLFAQEKFVLVTAGSFCRYQVVYVVILSMLFALSLWGIKSDLSLQRELLVRPDGTVNLSYGPRFWADGHDHCTSWHERYQGGSRSLGP